MGWQVYAAAAVALGGSSAWLFRARLHGFGLGFAFGALLTATLALAAMALAR